MSALDKEQKLLGGIGTEGLLTAYLSTIVLALSIACIYPYMVGTKPQALSDHSLSQATTAPHTDDSGTPSSLRGSVPSQVENRSEANAQGLTDTATENALEPEALNAARAGVADGAQEGDNEAANAFGLLESDFSLPGAEPRTSAVGGERSDPIRVRKTVAMGNGTIGSIPITIDSSSKLSLEAGDLRRLLSGQAGFSSRLERMPEEGIVSFERLRALGIDLRYNPTLDQVTLQAI